MRRTLVATAMLLALVATACGGASETTDTPAEPETTTTQPAETTTTPPAETTTTPPAETTTTQPAPEAVTVEVLDNNSFEPSEITINVGDTVSFSKTGGGLHNVNFQDESLPDSGAPTTETFTLDVTFNEPGTFTFICDVHVALGMTGTITVNP